MRQAGRYLPEYRAVREKAGGFLDLVFTPELAAEVTLQPVRRFGFDAAILFSDILVVPHALGQAVRFAVGEGPQLDPITDRRGFERLASELDHEVLAPVYETIRLVKRALKPGVALLGFCGAPWTVASYMIAGHGTPDQAPARLFAYRDAAALRGADRRAGRGVGGLSDPPACRPAPMRCRSSTPGRACCRPRNSPSGASSRRSGSSPRCARRCRKRKSSGFRAAPAPCWRATSRRPAVDAVGLDWMIDRAFARDRIQSRVPVQGNLDPLVLVAGGAALDRAVDAVLEAFAGGPFIFNLGHGILPETPIAHVERMLERVRRGKP